MQMRYIAAGALVVLTSCDSPRNGKPEPFTLCQEGDAATISIDHDRLVGLYEDYATLIGACGAVDSGCIDFPIRMSIPPRLPERPGEEVRWSVDNYHFRVRLRERAGSYLIRAEGMRPSGVPVREFYTYDVNEGVTSFREIRDRPHWVTWIRCAGRLTFNDLRELREKRALPDEQLRRLALPE